MNSSPKFSTRKPDRARAARSCAPARRKALVCLLLAGGAAVIAAASLCIGSVPVPPKAVLRALFGAGGQSLEARIVLYSRLPRTCAALLSGAALAAAGAIVQTVLQNPLAAPHIVGINAGAGLAVAACGALFPASAGLRAPAAFLGAVCGVGLVLLFARRVGASRSTLLLAGIAISSLFTAAIDALLTLLPDALPGYADFKVGGLSGVSMGRILPAAWPILLGLAAALSLSGSLDILALGADTARSLGLRVRLVQRVFLALAAVLAGAAISVCGLVGFVGLIIPGAARRLVGEESLPLLAASALGGAGFLTLCDLLARTLFAPYEIPVGILLSFVGVPCFLVLLVRKKGGHAHD